MERRKVETAAAKQQRDRKDISSFNKNHENYYNNSDSDMDLNQKDNFNLVKGCNGDKRVRDNTD